MSPKTYLQPLLAGMEPHAGLALLAGGPRAITGFVEWRRAGARLERRTLSYDAARALYADRVERFSQTPVMPFGFDPATPHLMGIVNVTPDSFSDGGRFASPHAAIAHGDQLVREGAVLLDVGGESTRPGATPVPPDEEQRRILPVIEALVSKGHTVSVDTRHAATMEAALTAGAAMINDVSALSHDPDALAVAANADCPIVLMHAQGNPQTMQTAPAYDHALLDIYEALEARINVCEAAGIDRARLITDPGIGFGKTLEHNLQLLAGLSLFHGLGCPILLGFSRKSVVGKLHAEAPVERRLAGSLAGMAAGLDAGVQFFRVHDVFESAQFLHVAGAIHSALR